MASFYNALICASLAAVLWTCVGLPLSLRLFPRSLAWPAAPALGWAVHSATALPLFCLVGMAKSTVIVVTAMTLFGSLIALWRTPWPCKKHPADLSIPLWTVSGAVVLAVAVMMLILPQVTDGGVRFADVMFDHSKVAMIDDMARLGVPAGNPFFGENDGLNRLSYYYLWHFCAAELAVLTGFSGWEADAGMTCFTAFSSLLLMMGLSRFLSNRPAAAGWVLILGTALSIRPIFRLAFGRELVDAVTGWSTGFGTWLFQMTWAPQHVASASCVLIAIILMVEFSKRQTVLTAIVLALVVAAGFESSAWVGGVTFPLAAFAVGALILIKIEPGARLRFVLSTTGAAVLAMVIASLFISDQFRASALRSNGFPIGFRPYEVLGEETPQSIRTFLDIPAYWIVYLFTELAAFYPAGIIIIFLLAKDRWLSQARKSYIAPLGILAFISLAVGSLLVSRLGDNNDLGWRGVLPAILVLIVVSGAGLARYLRLMPKAYAVVILGLIGLGSFEGIKNLRSDIVARPNEPSRIFAESSSMWEAARRHTKDHERIANNPLFLSSVTRWPINLSWALLSNRRSCYAGSGFGPFAPRTELSRDDVDAQFDRVFSGSPAANDLDQLANRYDCAVIVISSEDGAWRNDPFASSSLYSLVDEKADAWRIYRRRSSSTK